VVGSIVDGEFFFFFFFFFFCQLIGTLERLGRVSVDLYKPISVLIDVDDTTTNSVQIKSNQTPIVDDVKVFLSLALELRRQSHEVFLCTHAVYSELFSIYDVPLYGLSGDGPTTVLYSNESLALLEEGSEAHVRQAMEERFVTTLYYT